MIRLVPAVLAGALVLGIQPAQAAATKKVTLTPSETQTFAAWDKFLADGVQTWSSTHAPAFTPDVESVIRQVIKTDSTAEALANPMIQYLEWRRSLDPTRFTTYHPSLSPKLAQILSAPSLPTGVPEPTGTPTTAPQTVSSPQTVSPPPVPEPSSLLLATAMTGWAIWWRHRLAGQNTR